MTVVSLFLPLEVDDLVSQAESESFVEQADETETHGTITENTVSDTFEQEQEVVKKHSSVSAQTIPLEYVGRNKSTQTSKKLEEIKVTCATKGTQTFITNDFLTKFASLNKASTYSQTDPIAHDTGVNDGIGEVEDEYSLNNTKMTVPVELDVNNSVENSDYVDHDQQENELDLDFEGIESCGEEFLPTSGKESESDEESHEYPKTCEPVILTNDKSIQDQLKLIICEESIARTFGVCFKCGNRCTVSVGNTIGSFCKIYISCCFSADHKITWSTGPLLNRLPALNLLMASTILSTGLECNKTLRLVESLNILCFKRREFSNVESAYVIPAVVNVWRTISDTSLQSKLVSEIEGQSIEIASDMRVDSPGHSGLLGAGSTLYPDRNVILDTQIIKVLPAQ